MKLYAQVTSERASKGQGGNEFLEVELTTGNAKHKLGKIELKYIELNGSMNTHDLVEVRYFPPKLEGYKVLTTLEMPHKQGATDKCYICKRDDVGLTENDNGKLTCDDCWGKKSRHDPRICENSVPCLDCELQEKGKKQKTANLCQHCNKNISTMNNPIDGHYCEECWAGK